MCNKYWCSPNISMLLFCFKLAWHGFLAATWLVECGTAVITVGCSYCHNMKREWIEIEIEIEMGQLISNIHLYYLTHMLRRYMIICTCVSVWTCTVYFITFDIFFSSIVYICLLAAVYCVHTALEERTVCSQSVLMYVNQSEPPVLTWLRETVEMDKCVFYWTCVFKNNWSYFFIFIILTSSECCTFWISVLCLQLKWLQEQTRSVAVDMWTTLFFSSLPSLSWESVLQLLL